MTSIVPNLRKFPVKRRNANGCPHCKGSGITGRAVCAEIVKVDIPMMQFIEQGRTLDLLLYWRGLSDKKPESENMRGKICMEHAFQKLLNGKICPFDLEESFKPLDEMLLKTNDKPKDDDEKVETAGWSNI